LSGEISNATLRFLVTDGTDDAGSAYVVSNDFLDSSVSWSEDRLLFANAPPITNNPIATAGEVQPGDTLEFDVTSAITENGIVTFAIANQSNDAMMISSKEGVTAPQLVINTAPILLAKVSSEAALTAPHDQLPDAVRLFPSFPNPFNLQTRIRYDLPEDTEVLLVIYDLLGRKIKTLVRGFQSAGALVTNWDGRNNSGQPVSSGIYFVRLRTSQGIRTSKLVLQK
jgi:hypothetical protein